MSSKAKTEEFDRAVQAEARTLMEEGVQMRESARILRSHLHKVHAALLSGPHSEWILWRNVAEQADHTTHATFAEAFEAALTFLEQTGRNEEKP